jgi:hypothetical protein
VKAKTYDDRTTVLITLASWSKGRAILDFSKPAIPVSNPTRGMDIRGCIQKFPNWVDNEINNNNKHSLRSNTKDYGGKTHWSDSQNSDTTAASGRQLYHLQFLHQAASPETFGYNLVRPRFSALLCPVRRCT